MMSNERAQWGEGLRTMHWNINRGFSFKQFDIVNRMLMSDVQVTCVSEIGNYYGEEVNYDGYTIHARSYGSNHGVAMIVRDDLDYSYLGELEIRNTCWIRVHCTRGRDSEVKCIIMC